MKILFLIPARGGSKGIPGKNIKLFAGKPLIYYTIDIARSFVKDEFVCVSTDSEEIAVAAEKYNLKVPFKRPLEFAQDSSGPHEVMMHALNFYESKGNSFEILVWLQPTSPFRRKEDVQNCLSLFSSDLDMVVSVRESQANPYFNLMEEDINGYLIRSKKSEYKTRQSLPHVYQLNGAVYVINVNSLKKYGSIVNFPKTRKYIMDDIHSLDLDTNLDWLFCEYLIEKKGIVM